MISARPFWQLIDHWARPNLDALPVDKRATLRFVTGGALAGFIIAWGTVPMRAIEGNPAWLSLGMGIYWTLVLGLARTRGGQLVSAALLVVGVVALGVVAPTLGAQFAQVTYTPWMVLMGLTPVVFSDRRVALTVTLSGLAATLVALAGATPTQTRTFTHASEVFPVFFAGWLAASLSLSIQERAREEVQGQIDDAQQQRVEMDARAAELEARSGETLRFMTIMSHELRAPLNGVLGLSDLLAHEDIAQATRVRINRVRGSGRAVLRAFDTLRVLVRTTVEQSTGKSTVDLPALLDAELSRAAQAAMEQTQWTYEVALDTAVPRLVTVRAEALRTLLVQLVGILGDSRPERVVLTGAVAEGSLELLLTGVGTGAAAIDAQHREDLREMGLPLAYELARAVGGQCRLVSGRGPQEDLCVALSLPLKV
ncbi:MAG: hypothetical protein CSA66_08020 [Proteobacteria bacterium]|nr:MAG: hypothetical protein CSA66_08020 [Pseudomonadota bacterium]